MERILSRSISYAFAITSISMTCCGKRPPAKDDGEVRPPQFSLSGKEFEYKWEDQECIDGAKLGTDLAAATISSWSTTRRQDLNTSLEKIIDTRGEVDESVFTPLVSARTRFSRECANSSGPCVNNTGDEPGFTSLTPGDKPRFCQQSGNYGVDSVERVTLTSLISMKHALDFANKTYTENGAISNIHLLVLPRFESSFATGREQNGVRELRVLVDNLAYFPTEENSTPFIAVFPRKASATNEDPRLWEAPFVFSHELGHHIERYLRTDRYGAGKRSVVRSAVSEAFADLNGFATDNLDDKIIRNFPGICQDRAVGASSFRDNQAKIFDATEIRAIELHQQQSMALVSLEFETVSTGTIAKYTAHGIGAIFAHSVYSIFTMVFDAADIKSDKRATALALASAEWLKETDRTMGAGTTPRKDLLAAARSLETAAKNALTKYNISLTNNVADALCQRMALSFSGIEEKTWFGRNCTQSQNQPSHLTE